MSEHQISGTFSIDEQYSDGTGVAVQVVVTGSTDGVAQRTRELQKALSVEARGVTPTSRDEAPPHIIHEREIPDA
jgi:hypothetical protein